MRIAVISDIHGNFPAFDTVLNDAKQNGVSMFVFAGDYVFDLPYSNEVVKRIREINNAVVIGGNKEGYLSSYTNIDPTVWNLDQFGAMRQTYEELGAENLSYLRSLPREASVPLPGGRSMDVVHSSSRFIHPLAGAEFDVFSSGSYKKQMQTSPFTHRDYLRCISDTLNTPGVLKDAETPGASVTIFGHSHLQGYGYCNDKLYLNPGSCGIPLDGCTDAAYTILEVCETGFRIDERRVPYDRESVVHACKSSALYRKGRVWCDLVILSLRTGLGISDFFDLLERFKGEAGETEPFYSNHVWNRAASAYFNKQA